MKSPILLITSASCRAMRRSRAVSSPRSYCPATLLHLCEVLIQFVEKIVVSGHLISTEFGPRQKAYVQCLNITGK
ncbi:hypothetical protein TFLX_05352 [Thermoflexales bacterium]|nr:hypothetical protein TFLX_05352 [Thermoflexales bacterium]